MHSVMYIKEHKSHYIFKEGCYTMYISLLLTLSGAGVWRLCPKNGSQPHTLPRLGKAAKKNFFLGLCPKQRTPLTHSYGLGLPKVKKIFMKQARKPRSYASSKLRLSHLLTYLLTRVKSRATSIAKNNMHRIAYNAK